MDRRAAHAPREGLLIVGHGTRDREGLEEFWSLVRRTAAACPQVATQGCLLEFAEPTIAQGMAELVARDVDSIRVVPLMLFAAEHVLRDIPEQVAQAATGYAGLTTWQAPPLGCHPQLLKLSARRWWECLHRVPPCVAEQTVLVMIGRGSHTEGANAEMAAFARLRFEAEKVGWMELGFTSMARPSVAEVLQIAAHLPYRRIVVQPHLLFRGELLERVVAAVREQAEQDPAREWLVTGHLGAEPELVRTVWDRAGLDGGRLERTRGNGAERSGGQDENSEGQVGRVCGND